MSWEVVDLFELRCVCGWARLNESALVGRPRALDVVDVVGEGDKQIEKELAASVEHFHLHGTAALECVAAADDEGEVVSSQLGVIVGRVGVGVSGRQEDRVALDAGA